MKLLFLRLFKFCYFGLLLFAGMGLCCSYLAPFVPPSQSMLIAFAGLAYPMFLLIFLVGSIPLLWKSKKIKVKLLVLLLLLIGIGQHTHFFGSSFFSSESKKDGHLVMSYNVRMFDLYRWSEEDHYHDSIVDFIVDKQPEILGVQEFFHADLPHVEDTRYSLTRRLSTKDYHQKFSRIMNGEQFFGVVTFAAKKILKRGHIDFGNSQNNFCIYTDLLYQGDTLRVYHAHLASIRFEPEDYSAIEDELTIEGAKSILERLGAAFIRREEQVFRVRSSMDQCPYPFILLGDFNDPPTSYTYGVLSKGMNDAFLENSWGMGSTYRGKFPSFRIDYILGSPEVKFTSFDVYPKPYSDHFPIGATFELVYP